MANEQFESNSAHFAQTISKLQQVGISYLGAQQVLSGQQVTSPQDRALLANVVSATTQFNDFYKLRTGVHPEDKYYKVETSPFGQAEGKWRGDPFTKVESAYELKGYELKGGFSSTGYKR